MGEQLLNPADVAEILKVSKALAYKMLKEGEIPTVRFGKSVRVRREDLEKYIYEKTRLGTKGEGSDASGAGP
jgi:excisionase family DNA binding protein